MPQEVLGDFHLVKGLSKDERRNYFERGRQAFSLLHSTHFFLRIYSGHHKQKGTGQIYTLHACTKHFSTSTGWVFSGTLFPRFVVSIFISVILRGLFFSFENIPLISMGYFYMSEMTWIERR
jgi:hypothetical protein